MKRVWIGVAALAFVAAAEGRLEAQVKERWWLKYEQDKPQIYTHRDKSRGIETYWYFTFTVTNATDQRVPLLVDIQLYVESGRGMKTDVQKVHIPTISSVFDRDHGPATFRPYESKLYGRFYSSVINPEAEYDIVAHDLRLGNRLRDADLQHHVNGLLGGNKGIIEESILAFKRKNYYLNPREMRIKGHLQPGEKVHGIAIYTDVDPRANVIETHTSGLQDVFKLSGATDEGVLVEYENKVFVTTYEFRGDAFERVKDQLLPPPKKKWMIKRIGPIASKETMAGLMQMMNDYVKFHQQLLLEEKTPAEIEKARRDYGISESDVHNAALVFQKAIVIVDFGYDRDKSPYENRHVLWRMHEWWLTNKPRLMFDVALNRWVIDPEGLPGHERAVRDH